MNSDVFDFAIIGESLAAASAALTLSKTKLRGVWLADGYDSGGIDSLVEIRSPFGEMFGKGDRYRQRVYEMISGSIDIDGVVDHVKCIDGVLELSASGEGLAIARSLIVAPFGSEMKIGGFPDIDLFRGRGVSEDAYADAACYAGMPVVVIGSGYRAAEQGLIAAEFASQVTILSDGALQCGELKLRLDNEPNVHILTSGELERVEGEIEHGLTSIQVRIRGTNEQRTVPARALFLAQALEFRAECYGGREALGNMGLNCSLFTAGLADGVDHSNRDSAVESGRVAANSVRRLLSKDPQ